ncbi:MAG: DUF4040 domain-containing protein [Lachnospiraceae bacterium]|nr:DUF4040 domain-containing protein [Lachnospiraceae bacterium]
MTGLEVFKIILLILLVICAISVNLTKRLLQAVVVFMAYSTIMAVVWTLLESPDLAITEAAVGAGITSILFFLTLRKLSKMELTDLSDPELKEHDSPEEKNS